jgi:hypothetical protein
MGKPQRSQRTQRREGNREDREHFCNGLGLQATDHFPSKQVWIRAWSQPTPMARSKTPPRPLREAFRMGKPQRSQRTQRRGGNREDREHFCNGLGLQATDHFPSKQVWIRAWPQPTPMARSKTPPRPLRETLWMGKPQRSQRTQRRGGNREDREHFCNGLGQQVTDHFPSKQVWIRAWSQPTPMARSKTSPRPLRETLWMGRSGWESGYLYGRPLPQQKNHAPTSGRGDDPSLDLRAFSIPRARRSKPCRSDQNQVPEL